MKTFSRTFVVICLALLCIVSVFAQVPGYQLPSTLVAQKWYGSGAPTAALNIQSQPGDMYYDTTNKVAYWCAAPATSIIPLQGGSPACTTVTSGGWTLFVGSSGSSTGTGAIVLATSPTLITPALGTPSALLLTNATGTPTGAGVMLDTGTINLTLTQLQTLNSVGYTILPAPGATSMYQMGSCTMNLTYGSAAFTGGGTVSIGYGTTSTPATNATIASTVFTTFTASHGVVVLPAAVAVTATTSLVNKAIVMTAASADFAVGTGATGQLDCQYRILTGVQ